MSSGLEGGGGLEQGGSLPDVPVPVVPDAAGESTWDQAGSDSRSDFGSHPSNTAAAELLARKQASARNFSDTIRGWGGIKPPDQTAAKESIDKILGDSDEIDEEDDETGELGDQSDDGAPELEGITDDHPVLGGSRDWPDNATFGD